MQLILDQLLLLCVRLQLLLNVMAGVSACKQACLNLYLGNTGHRLGSSRHSECLKSFSTACESQNRAYDALSGPNMDSRSPLDFVAGQSFAACFGLGWGLM